MGDLLTVWTIRVSAALYLATVLILLRRTRTVSQLDAARWLWTLGFILYVEHIVCAFEFVHHWNHAVAYAETARQTAQTVGVEWGGGIYINYLFGLVWGADVLWWWLRPASHARRPLWASAAVHGFLVFIMFNACVVFAPRPMLWWGLAGTGVLLLAVGRSLTRPAATFAVTNGPPTPNRI